MTEIRDVRGGARPERPTTVERVTGFEPAPLRPRLTVLGRCSPFPGTAGGCPGYLLQGGGVKVLVDCGPGVLGKLAPRLKPSAAGRRAPFAPASDSPAAHPATASSFAGLDAVVVSHLHADHFSELLSLRYAIAADIRDGYRPGRLAIHVPPEPTAEREVLDYPRALDLATIDEGSRLEIGPFELTFKRTSHPLHCLAMKVRAGGSTLVYTADTAWDDDLVAWAGGPPRPDLLLVEASLQDAQAHLRELGHLTAREAGRFGALTGAGLTVLTHLYPEFDLGISRREAAEGYAAALGPVQAPAQGPAAALGPTSLTPRLLIPEEGQEFTF